MSGTAKKVLLAEDEKSMSQALELKLTQAGFEVKTSFDGRAALDRLLKEYFDLVLLDIVMPKMSGFEVLKELQLRKVEVPVIVMSNLGQAEDKRRALELGAKDYLVKADIPIANFIEYVKKTLGV